MVLVSINEYDPRLVAQRWIIAQKLDVSGSRLVQVRSIDDHGSGGTLTLSVMFSFDAARTEMFFQGVDPRTFRPDLRRRIDRCAFCGLELQYAVDIVHIEVSPPSYREVHHLRAHAACVSSALGPNSKIDFIMGIPILPAELPDNAADVNGLNDNFRKVRDRIMEGHSLDFGPAVTVELAAVDVAHNATVVFRRRVRSWSRRAGRDHRRTVKSVRVTAR